MTDKDASASYGGCIFYDAGCPLCVAGVRRIGGVFVRRGFVWEPLQTPRAAVTLGDSAAETLGEMKLSLADGRIVGGADAWAELFRSVWWLWPVGTMLTLPGFNWIGHAIYRWLARHRYCFSPRCQFPRAGARRALPHPHRHTAFLELP